MAVVAGGRLFGALAESSIHEGIGRGDAVVLVGVVVALGDFVQELDEVAGVVGLRENGVGEIACWVG